MSAADEQSRHTPRLSMAFGALVMGTGLIAASLVWTHLPGDISGWSTGQAMELQSASASLHELSHKYEAQLSRSKANSLPPEFASAKEKFDQLKQQLDAARERPGHIAAALFVAGTLLSVGGGTVYFARRQT